MHRYLPYCKSLVSRIIATLFPLLLLSSAALADDAALLRCRGIAEAAARLACYDALPLTASEAKPGRGEPARCASDARAVRAGRESAPAAWAGRAPKSDSRSVRGLAAEYEHSACQRPGLASHRRQQPHV